MLGTWIHAQAVLQLWSCECYIRVQVTIRKKKSGATLCTMQCKQAFAFVWKWFSNRFIPSDALIYMLSCMGQFRIYNSISIYWLHVQHVWLQQKTTLHEFANCYIQRKLVLTLIKAAIHHEHRSQLEKAFSFVSLIQLLGFLVTSFVFLSLVLECCSLHFEIADLYGSHYATNFRCTGMRKMGPSIL